MHSLLIRNVRLDGQTRDVLIQDGRFARIEPRIEGQAKETLDAGERKAMVPAFYNAHTHAAMTLLRGYADDLPLFEWLQNYIWPMEAKLTAEDIYAGTKLGCVEMIRSGTVFCNDMYWHHAEAIRAVAEMGMRVCGGPVILDAFDPAHTPVQREAVESFLRRKDSFPPTVIPALAPHSVYGVRPETLAWIAEQAAASKVRVHIHLSETKKEVQDCIEQHGCRPTEYLHRMGLLSPRTLAAHAVHLSDRDRALLAENGVTVIHMPVSNMKLSNGAFDFPAARRQGLRITLGTDGCSSNNSLDMIQEMKFGALLAKHFSGDPTAFPAPDAFRAATRDAAEAFGLDAGLIEPGRLADCLLVDLDAPRMTPAHNLVSNLVYSADSSVIDTVICGGRILMKNRIIEGEEEILREAQSAVQRMLQAD